MKIEREVKRWTALLKNKKKDSKKIKSKEVKYQMKIEREWCFRATKHDNTRVFLKREVKRWTDLLS